MAKTIPIPEHFQHFLAEMKEGFWGMCTGRPRRVWKQLSAAALWQWPLPAGFRDPFGTIRLRMARTRGKGFPPRGIARFQRRGTKRRHNTSRVESGAQED
jgi:hypothetical protein